jgi:hypothetical protein
MIALLYDVADDGRATFITRGAALVAGGGGRRSVSFDLYPQDWRLASGHRLGVLLTASDQDAYLPPHSGATVDVAGGALEVPFLRYRRDSYLPGRVTPAILARQPIPIAAETVRTGIVGADIPPALVDPPAGGSRAALRVAVRRLGSRRLLVTVHGVGTSPVRLAVQRGRQVVARRTVAARGGVARATLAVRRPGAYRVRAVALGTPRLSALSRVVRIPR